MGRQLFLAVGSLNREAPYFQGARGEGLTVFAFDEATLDFERIVGTSSVDNPTFLSVDDGSGLVYANSEVFGWQEGTVSAFRFSPENGSLGYLNKQATLGSIAAHNLLTNNGRFLLVANYGMGEGGPDQSVAVFPRRDDGSIAPAITSVRHEGALGTDVDRQERPHAHMVLELIGGGVLVSDLGLDQLIEYSFDTDGNFARLGAVSLPPGSGPRHIAQHPAGRYLFVSNELDSTVSVIVRDNGRMVLQQTVSSLQAPTASFGADIHLSPDGRFLYSSNRGDDSIAVFAVDGPDGALTLLEIVPSGGATPRNFALTPSGNHLLVANQNSDAIVIFRRDAESGRIRDSGKRIAIGTPVCVRPFWL